MTTMMNVYKGAGYKYAIISTRGKGTLELLVRGKKELREELEHIKSYTKRQKIAVFEVKCVREIEV